MNTSFLLFAEFIASATISLAVLYALSTPLLNILRRICPDEHAATFWLSYTKVILMILPLLLVLTADMLTDFKDPVDSLRLGFIAVFAGLLLGLQSIGKRLGKFVVAPRQPGGVK